MVQSTENLDLVGSGGSMLGPGGTGLPSLGYIVISLSRCCLPNDEGPGP